MSLLQLLSKALICAVLMVVPLNSQAMLIDKQLVLRPIQICNNFGDCANEAFELFEEVGDAIWAQAGIDLMFEEFTTVVDHGSFNISASELTGFTGFNSPPGPNWFVNAPGGIPDTNVINLWFTNSIQGFGSGEIFGFADADAELGGTSLEAIRNNILIGDLVFNGQFPASTVIAHEVGHILGLLHCDYEQTFPFRGYVPCARLATDDFDQLSLMTPQGVGSTYLTTPQREAARQSAFLVDFEAVPLPAPWSLLGFGLAFLFVRERSTRLAGRH
ncbi:MAG: hypothetical protein AB8C02_16925 [Halioglobus sp.]